VKQLLAAASGSATTKETGMSTENKTPAAEGQATFEELKAGCVGADAAFICSQLEAKATLKQATAAWMSEQQKRIEAANKATEEAKAASVKAAEDAKAAAAKPGVKAITTSNGNDPVTEGSPIVQWNEAVAGKVKAGLPRDKAIAAVARENPDLHDAYLIAYNEEHQPKVNRKR
jgi:hypothetical protein